MSTTEKNRLIADFIGYENNIYKETGSIVVDSVNHWYLKDVKHYYIGGEWCADYNLEFHMDWNWIVEAVGKCFVGEAELSPEQSKKYITPIYTGLCNLDIVETHSAVVEFIKWYNENKN